MFQVIEPYRMKVIEPIHNTDRAERDALLAKVAFNLYRIDSQYVYIDLLTDSGTCAISSTQQAAMMRGDESYAGSSSYRRFESAVREVFGFRRVVPTHQGRAAERLLFQCVANPGDIVPSNTFFETTRANCLAFGIEPLDLPSPTFWNFDSADEFKGDMDCEALEELLSSRKGTRVPFVLLTITNNMCGDQPVSMANIRHVHQIASRYGKPIYYDACRYAQNAWFVQAFEPGYQSRPIREIVSEMFSYSEGCIFSAKKDALGRIGGFFATRSEELDLCAKEQLLLSEGYVTYGGMTGGDMDAIAIGLIEGLDDEYLRYRVETTRYLYDRLREYSIPVLSPSGGHAVYVDAGRILPHLRESDNPGQALAVEIYAASGIRTTRIALNPDRGPARGRHIELVRLALPSRVYSTRHLDFVAASIGRVANCASLIKGLNVVSSPRFLGGFLAQYKCATASCDSEIVPLS